MGKESVTIKVWIETRKLLRLISAMTGESILEVVQRLASEEWKRVQNDTSTQDQAKPDA
jgi:hypothetical protein